MAGWAIGEVERFLGLPASTLRHWEKVIPLLAPRKDDSGRRVYSEADLRVLLRLKHLVAVRGLGLAEASEALMAEAGKPGSGRDGEVRARLAEIRGELIGLYFESLRTRRAMESSGEALRPAQALRYTGRGGPP